MSPSYYPYLQSLYFLYMQLFDGSVAVMGFSQWNEERHIFANSRFEHEFITLEEMQSKHKQGGIPPYFFLSG